MDTDDTRKAADELEEAFERLLVSGPYICMEPEPEPARVRVSITAEARS